MVSSCRSVIRPLSPGRLSTTGRRNSSSVWSRLVRCPASRAMPVRIETTLFVTDQTWSRESAVEPWKYSSATSTPFLCTRRLRMPGVSLASA